MSTFHIKIITSTKVFYEGPCYSVVIPALDGEMEIMANHAEMIVATCPGEMRFRIEENGEQYRAIVGQGFCLIANNRATLLADQIERPEEVDANRAREALERAQERMRQKQSIQEYHMTQAAMARALVRLKETERFIH
ncbi:MAG TPA: ATP synthase F1 subunit epsilon [Lachnospiraceae bacterium]|nr:ATP synthase F1 subunit epsilon [Lachnospiraceae bacterium]